MLTFKNVTQRDLTLLRRYYENCPYRLCEYSALVKLMWREHLHSGWAEEAGCLIVCNCIDGKLCFDFPVPGPEGDVDAALRAIDALSAKGYAFVTVEELFEEMGVEPELGCLYCRPDSVRTVK